MEWRDEQINVPGGEIATRDYGGDGRDLILLPGGGRNLCDWEVVVPRLIQHHRIVCADLPGHGLSSEPERWDWDDAVTGVERVSAALRLENPFVVGHSL